MSTEDVLSGSDPRCWNIAADLTRREKEYAESRKPKKDCVARIRRRKALCGVNEKRSILVRCVTTCTSVDLYHCVSLLPSTDLIIILPFSVSQHSFLIISFLCQFSKATSCEGHALRYAFVQPVNKSSSQAPSLFITLSRRWLKIMFHV
jgi:hypothetical protein